VTALRSALFDAAVLFWTTAMTLACLPLLISRKGAQASLRAHAWGLLGLLRILVGLSHAVRGRENLPAGACIVAANHQSAWETVGFYRVLPDAAFVLKRSLVLSPTGWYPIRGGSVAIDRAAGAGAVKRMVRAMRGAVARGQQIVIFPEGTRTPPLAHRPFQPGVAALYAALGVPVVPVALNSGVFWPRKSLLLRPGTLTVEILPPIPPGLPRKAFMARLESAVREAADRLAREATAGSDSTTGLENKIRTAV
jgi:1-acyl-sn-glycerol-3-phosphate acyltransferase